MFEFNVNDGDHYLYNTQTIYYKIWISVEARVSCLNVNASVSFFGFRRVFSPTPILYRSLSGNFNDFVIGRMCCECLRRPADQLTVSHFSGGRTALCGRQAFFLEPNFTLRSQGLATKVKKTSTKFRIRFVGFLSFHISTQYMGTLNAHV